jgi:hypothetical protein
MEDWKNEFETRTGHKWELQSDELEKQYLAEVKSRRGSNQTLIDDRK